MDLFEINDLGSNESNDPIKTRMKTHVPRIIKQALKEKSLDSSGFELKKYVEKMIAYAFGFMQHAKLIESGEWCGNKMYKISTEPESFLVQILIIDNDNFISDLNSSELSKNECSPKFIIETNFDIWKLHEITENQKYKIIFESKLKLDEIDTFIEKSILMCKEFTTVKAITDKYNRKRVYNYFDDKKSLIEITVQFEFILFEDNSEIVWLPKYKETFWSSDLIGARKNARIFIEKTILFETGKLYKIENQSESLDLKGLIGEAK